MIKAPISILFILAISCGKTNFNSSESGTSSNKTNKNASVGASESSDSEQNKPVPVGGDKDAKTVSVEFFQAKVEEVNVMLSLDSSRSMEDSQSYVASNLESFLNKISKFSNVKIGIINNPTFYDFKQNLPAAISSKIDFYNRPVLSRDPLVDYINVLEKEGANFYSPKANPILFVVTDHESNIDANEFYSQVSAIIDLSRFKLYGFTGFQGKEEGSSGCDIEQRGLVYEAIAKKSASTVYDVCEPDWTDEFNKITADILDFTNSFYSLKRKATEVISVKIDGKEIPKTTYTVNEDKLFVDKSLVSTGNETIEISYR